jgi:hypothetical protein
MGNYLFEISQIVRDINTIEDLEKVQDIIHVRWNAIMQAKASSFYPGEAVWFDDRDGVIHYGNVLKVNTKSIKVDVPNSRPWNVAPTLLHKVEEA